MSEDEEKEAWDAELKPRERTFCLHYCTDEATAFSAADSYKAAYTRRDRATQKTVSPDDATSRANGARLLKRPRVAKAIKRLFEVAQGEADTENAYRILHDVAKLALFNPADILDEHGNLVADLKELGDNAKAIAQIQKTKNGTQFVLVDREKYASMLLKYLNLAREESKVQVNLPVIELQAKVENGEISAVDAWNRAAEESEKE